MSAECSTDAFVGAFPPSSRDFDYGIGDDVRHAERQVREEIAARIRRAAWQDPTGTSRERLVYEQAARIAEGLR